MAHLNNSPLIWVLANITVGFKDSSLLYVTCIICDVKAIIIRVEHLTNTPLTWALGCTNKCWTRLQILALDYHSSLVFSIVSDEEKALYAI